MHPTPPGAGGSPPNKEAGGDTDQAPAGGTADYLDALMAEMTGGAAVNWDEQGYEPIGVLASDEDTDPGTGDGAAAGDGADLDDLLAQLDGGVPIASQAEVQQQLQALLDEIAGAANTGEGAVPAGEIPAPLLPRIPAGLFESFGPNKVQDAVTDSIDCGILQHIVARGGLGLEAAQLAPVVKSIRESYLAGEDRLVEPYGDIVAAMIADQPSLAGVARLVRDPGLVIPPPQAGAVQCFQQTFPAFWQNLKGKVGIKFNSHLADTVGGGLFEPKAKMIYMSSLPYSPACVFLRLVVHEMGHAAFELTLLGGKAISVVLDAATVAELTGDPLTLGPEIEEVRACWVGMPAPAKVFYHSWLTLRRNDGCHLLGLDLWQDPILRRLSPDRRQRYQAGQFSEFCAETFMQFAMGDLHSHVVTILSDHTIGDDVKNAWKNAWAVLMEVARPMLDGKPWD